MHCIQVVLQLAAFQPDKVLRLDNMHFVVGREDDWTAHTCSYQTDIRYHFVRTKRMLVGILGDVALLARETEISKQKLLLSPQVPLQGSRCFALRTWCDCFSDYSFDRDENLTCGKYSDDVANSPLLQKVHTRITHYSYFRRQKTLHTAMQKNAM